MKGIKLCVLSLALAALFALTACNGGVALENPVDSTVVVSGVAQNIQVNFTVAENGSSSVVQTTERPLKEVLKDIRPTVVEVYATYSDQLSSSQSSGAGVVIATGTVTGPTSGDDLVSDSASASASESAASSVASDAEQGVISYIATCYHVVENATEISVVDVEGNIYAAKPIGADDQTDICVLSVSAKLSAATFTDSSEIEVGEDVVAIGNPLGTLGGTVTKGIVSATNRDIVVNNVKMNLIQTDAAVNGGNSGGGLFTADGLLVGLVNAKYRNTYYESVEGLAFAIPSDTVKDISAQLMETYTGTSLGYIPGRYYLGSTVANRFTSVWQSSSYVIINKIDTRGSLYKGGLRAGDQIVSVEYGGVETPVTTAVMFSEYLDGLGLSVGDTLTFNIRRDNYNYTFQVEILQYVCGAE